MEFGIQHGMGDPSWQPPILDPGNVTHFARSVEAAGFAHLAFTDHPSPSASWIGAGGEGTADLFTSLGFCAAATERIGLLTWMLVVPYHNPLVAAHRIATLDRLSGGRLTLGVGTGYLKSEFFAVGADFVERREAFVRHLDAIRHALTGDPVDADGPGYSARAVQVQPPVVQRPHPPIWVHGNSRFGVEWAARHGQGWVGLQTTDVSVKTIRTTALPDLDAFAQRIRDVRAAAESAGRRPDALRLIATGVVPMLDIRRPWSRDAYQDRFGRLEELGIDTVVVNACGDDPTVSVESAEAFAAAVIA